MARKVRRRRVCAYCLFELRWTRDRGWVHPQGGVYFQRCFGCGWWGAPEPSVTYCPQCSSAAVGDDHYALPA